MAALRERGVAPASEKTYTIATTAYVARKPGGPVGRIDLTMDHLREHGFATT